MCSCIQTGFLYLFINCKCFSKYRACCLFFREITEGNVVVKDFDKAVLTAQENEPVRIIEKIVGEELIVTSKGEKFISVEKTPTSFRW